MGSLSFPPLVAAVAGLSATGICLLCPRASDDDFAGLTATFYQSEQWLVRYRDMDFIQNVLNGMASRRPRLDALRDSWYDLDAHYDALETRFWQFYPRMMAQASRKSL